MTPSTTARSGNIIGHELTHGFDDQGRRYDSDGNLKAWWTPEDERKYIARANMLEQQYNAYVGIDDIHVNGRQTLGENIADLGGVTLAYLALQRSLAGKPRPAAIDGFSADQRFFLAFAQIWRGNTRPERVRLLLENDNHSPRRARVVGPLSNMPQFAGAFGCKPGSPMVRPEERRVTIW